MNTTTETKKFNPVMTKLPNVKVYNKTSTKKYNRF